MSKNIDLAKKLKALADRGVDGEKTNAEAMLNSLMKKHNITIEEIEGEELLDFFFKIEKSKINTDFIDLDRKELKKNLHMDRFVKNIKSKIFPLYND